MKTITLDYEIYINELKAEREAGRQHGINCVLSHIKDPNGYGLYGDAEFRNRQRVEEAIEKRMATIDHIQKLLDGEDLFVFNPHTRSCDEVTSYCMNGSAVQLHICEKDAKGWKEVD